MSEHYDLLKNIRERYKNEHNSYLSNYETQGVADGKSNSLENHNDRDSPAELGIRADYKGMLTQFRADTAPICHELKTTLQQTIEQQEFYIQNPQVLVEKKEQVIKNYENLIEENQNLLTRNISSLYSSADYQNCILRFNDAKDKFNRLSIALNRSKPIIQRWWYIPLLFLIGVSEFALNYAAFTQFKGSVLTTMLMALSAGVVFPILAHFIGKIIRENSESKKSISVAVILLIVAVLLNYFIAKQVVTLGQAQKYIKTTQEANNNLFFRFTLVFAIFLAGCLISFFLHEPNVEFGTLFKSLEKSRNLKEKKEKEIDLEVSKLNSNFQNKLQNLNVNKQKEISEINNIVANLNTLRSKSESELSKAIEFVSNTLATIKSWYLVVIHKYRSRYITSNTSNKTPSSWTTDPAELN